MAARIPSFGDRLKAVRIVSGVEALRQGGLGLAEAVRLYWKPSGFKLEDIHTKVYCWHGADDLNAPVDAHGKVLAQRLPDAVAYFFPGEGYISLIHKHKKDIL